MGNKSGKMTPSAEEVRRHNEARRSAAMLRSYGYTLSDYYSAHGRNRYRQPDNEVEEMFNERLLEYRDHILPFPLPWTEHLKVLLCGTRSTDGGDQPFGRSPLSLLAGHEDSVIRHIYDFVVGSWKASVKPARPARLLAPVAFRYRRDRPTARDVAFSPCGKINFPPPENRKANMLPFVLGDRTSLPTNLQIYYDLVIAKCPVPAAEYGRVCYLTVHESWVEAGQIQRRGGLHVEAPGTQDGLSGLVPGTMAHWGCGDGDKFFGGLFMASSVADTTEIFDDLIDHQYGTVDKHGGIEHLRPYLGEGTLLDANELVWFTDRTPHEALPQTRAGYRQFFRLVTSNLSVWYEEHSTSNPKVPLPKDVKIIRGSKF